MTTMVTVRVRDVDVLGLPACMWAEEKVRAEVNTSERDTFNVVTAGYVAVLAVLPEASN
jgi:hypothetical protein